MTEDELRDELMTLLLAGHETTATSLSWAFACLLENPDCLAKLDGELATARTPAGGLDLAALPRLEYLDAVIKESMRLRPILPDVVRKLTAPMVVAGHEIPAGANLMPCIYLAHRRPEAYPEPLRFRPERFASAKVDPYTWLPFGGGIRRCLGMAFALYEMKIVLAEMLLHARFNLLQRPRVVRRTITLAPSGGTRAVMVERL
jgi:cytochrome P450